MNWFYFFKAFLTIIDCWDIPAWELLIEEESDSANFGILTFRSYCERQEVLMFIGLKSDFNLSNGSLKINVSAPPGLDSVKKIEFFSLNQKFIQFFQYLLPVRPSKRWQTRLRKVSSVSGRRKFLIINWKFVKVSVPTLSWSFFSSSLTKLSVSILMFRSSSFKLKKIIIFLKNL